jgi:hypothetical protein
VTGRGKGKVWVVSLSAFTALSLLSALQQRLWSLGTPSPATWTASLFSGLAWMGPWGFVAPLVLWLGNRKPFDRDRLPAFVGWHLAGMVAVLPPIWIVQSCIAVLGRGIQKGWGPGVLKHLKPDLAELVVLFLGVPLTYIAILMAGEALRGWRLAGQLAEARLALLQRQIHPHFLFNALQAVSTLLHRDPVEADRTLVKLSSLLRRTLDDCGGRTTPLRTELELVTTYLEIERVRFGDRLAVAVEAPEEALAMPVPSLILLPLVENAIRHGLSRKPGPGRIGIRVWTAEGLLHLAVEDDGPGIQGPLREGIGLGSTRQRLDAMFGSAAGLSLLPPHAGGFRAEAWFPPREGRP